ncbi:MAG: DNA polymerase III subunit delta [Oscillospiraceae bacterium]|nr:DNA polymerase III subunit delta [Oscillospiraceae bacterium]
MDFWQQFGGALNRLGHAYILACPDRETLREGAGFLSAAYVCTGQGRRPCLQCAGCRKAAGGVHPDILEIAPAPDKRDITVEQIRQLRRQAPVLPNEAPRKVFVIDQAHTMNASGQNALLKRLEDGPSYLAFLLLVEYPQQLLPTVRSRCECLFLRPQGAGEEPEQAAAQAAQKLAGLLLAGDEAALAEYAAELERGKWSRESLRSLLDCLEEQLRPQAGERPGRAVPALEQVKRVRRGLACNMGAGHLLGWLAAGTFL